MNSTNDNNNSNLSVQHLIKNYDDNKNQITKFDEMEASNEQTVSSLDDQFNIMLERDIKGPFCTMEKSRSNFKKSNFSRKIVTKNNNVVNTEIFHKDDISMEQPINIDKENISPVEYKARRLDNFITYKAIIMKWLRVFSTYLKNFLSSHASTYRK